MRRTGKGNVSFLRDSVIIDNSSTTLSAFSYEHKAE